MHVEDWIDIAIDCMSESTSFSCDPVSSHTTFLYPFFLWEIFSIMFMVHTCLIAHTQKKRPFLLDHRIERWGLPIHLKYNIETLSQLYVFVLYRWMPVHYLTAFKRHKCARSKWYTHLERIPFYGLISGFLKLACIVHSVVKITGSYVFSLFPRAWGKVPTT